MEIIAAVVKYFRSQPTIVWLTVALTGFATITAVFLLAHSFAVPGSTVKFGFGMAEFQKKLSIHDEQERLQREFASIAAVEGVSVDFDGPCGPLVLTLDGVRSTFNPRYSSHFPKFYQDSELTDGTLFSTSILDGSETKQIIAGMRYNCQSFANDLDTQDYSDEVMEAPVVMEVMEAPVVMEEIVAPVVMQNVSE